MGAAPPDGTPSTWHPLSADAKLRLPEPGERCWRGYCGVHHVVVRLVAPNADGPARVLVTLAADDARLHVPLQMAVTPRHPEAQSGPDAVTIQVPHERRLHGVRLQGPDGSWAARGAPDGFAVARQRLPSEVPLRPVATLENGTPIQGPPITLPPDGRPPDEEPGPPPPDEGNATATAPANRSGGTPSEAGNRSAEDLPRTPVRAPEQGAAAPGPGGLVVAALAAAARATI